MSLRYVFVYACTHSNVNNKRFYPRPFHKDMNKLLFSIMIMYISSTIYGYYRCKNCDIENNGQYTRFRNNDDNICQLNA